MMLKVWRHEDEHIIKCICGAGFGDRPWNWCAGDICGRSDYRDTPCSVGVRADQPIHGATEHREGGADNG
jgi:acetone carboxylase gamma subunit